MRAEPRIGRRDRVRDTARICPATGDVEFGRGQLRSERVSHVLAGRLLHYRNDLRLGVSFATECQAGDAPRRGMILPVANASNARATRSR